MDNNNKKKQKKTRDQFTRLRQKLLFFLPIENKCFGA